MTLASKVDLEPDFEVDLEETSTAEDRAGKSSEAFRTIGEAAAELGLKTHVLRFWETKFEELSPMKRADGRRYYRPEDMAVLRTLQNLLHVQGLTIRGAVKVLRDNDDLSAGADDADSLAPDTGASVRDLQAAVQGAVDRGDFQMAARARDNAEARERLESLLEDLSGLKSRLDRVRLAG
ncbi:MAG: MerR family transcriptional regulator [Alphaproteobacteria bacterium]|nr:MerR family transcriptional regulator [Alphaproteobacteria bacterium]